MDPASALGITSTCMTLSAHAGTVIMRITVFVSQVRNARKDLDAVSRELTSLQLCLSALKDDQQLVSLNLPEAMRTQISQILVNIDLVLNQISDKLIKLSSGKLGRRIQWVTMEKDEMDKFRSSLESNKTALEIALTIGSISILAKQVQNSARQEDHMEVLLQRTESVALGTRTIDGKLDTLTDMHRDDTRFDRLAKEIDSLRTYMTSLATAPGNNTLNTFRLNSEAYTQSLLQPLQASLSGPKVVNLIALPSQLLPSLSQKASCNCEDTYKARQQGLKLHYQERLAEYESRHKEDMIKLQELEKYIDAFYEAEEQNLRSVLKERDVQCGNLQRLLETESEKSSRREDTIVSLQQKVQQEVARNATFRTEIETLKTQIEENARLKPALRTSYEKQKSYLQRTRDRLANALETDQ